MFFCECMLIMNWIVPNKLGKHTCFEQSTGKQVHCYQTAQTFTSKDWKRL